MQLNEAENKNVEKKVSYKGVHVVLPSNVSISAFKDIVDKCGKDYSITVQSVINLLSRKLNPYIPNNNPKIKDF